MTMDAYIRYPHIRDEQIVFVADDDIWLVERAGGRAYRVTSDHLPARSPRLSPDGTRVAWTATRDGAAEVYVAGLDGADTTRLTFWGTLSTAVRGWLADEEVLAVSSVGEGGRERLFAYAVPLDGTPARRLPYGWAHDLALGPDGGVLLSTLGGAAEPAWWKHYRGGTASQLWLDLTGGGEFRRIFADLPSSLASPVWAVGDDGRARIGFVSDHEGRGQLYSAVVGRRAPTSARLARHTDGTYYARHATSDGRQVVYAAGGSLFLLESLDAGVEPREVEVRLGGPRWSRRTQVVSGGRAVGHVSPDWTGRASAVEARGTVAWLTHRDGPVRSLADGSDVRRRLPTVLGGGSRVAWVTDEHGDDAIEVVDTENLGAARQLLVAAGRAGRVLELAASPDGRRLAIATHDGRLLLAPVPEGQVTRSARLREVDRTDNGDLQGLAFSPDSRWLAWSAPAESSPLRHIKATDLGGRGGIVDVTPGRFIDTDPCFTRDGRFIALLSHRSFDPVYDALTFDLSFPGGCRPHLVALAADTRSPFDAQVGGRPWEAPPQPAPADGGGGQATPAADNAEASEAARGAAAPARPGSGATGPGSPPATTVDVAGLDQRLIPVPVPAGRYSALQAVDGGLVWLREPLRGETGDDRARLTDEPERPSLQHLDLKTGVVQALADAVDSAHVTGDGKRLVVRDHDSLRVVPANRKVEQAPGQPPNPDVAEVDLGRLRVTVRPLAEWHQMYDEAWRLMRDHFWRPDMGGVDWPAIRERYGALLDRLGSRDDLVDLIWEMHGELGSSHAYCFAPPEPPDASRRQGLLGADLEADGDAWVVSRVVPGEASDPNARSPLAAPGVGVTAGDRLVAVDGRPVSAGVSPSALLVGAAGKPVELVVAPKGGGPQRRVVVVPLAGEDQLRYQDWVRDRREYVHERTAGRVGYLHVPDMMFGGWAQLHRDLTAEVGRDGLVVDVRGNRGGFISQLVVEKLLRTIIGWDLVRGYHPDSYPRNARRGPMVAVADMYAGSDGDIVTAAIRTHGLGPVIGTRTWGGVIGIDGRYSLVDGTMVTQPRYAFWFEKFGWGVENYGVDPDIEVVATPQDQTARRDVQLDRALQELERLMRRTPPKLPPEIPPLR